MKRQHAIVLGLATGSLVVGGPATAAVIGTASLDHARTLSVLDVRQASSYLDLGKKAQGNFDPSPGDTYFFRSQLRNVAGTNVVGRFVSSCTALLGTEFHCAGTIMISGGTLELATTVYFASSAPIHSAITGGTGRYRNVGGDVTITATSTAGTSKLVARLLPIK
jgi:hypothetical protein